MTDTVFRFVDPWSGVVGSTTTSVGSSGAGITDEMYATSTSGTGPTGGVRSRTGRSFIPALPPKGKFAR